MIAMSVLVLNLRKIQSALLRLLTYLLAFYLLGKNRPLFSRHYIDLAAVHVLFSPNTVFPIVNGAYEKIQKILTEKAPMSIR